MPRGEEERARREGGAKDEMPLSFSLSLDGRECVSIDFFSFSLFFPFFLSDQFRRSNHSLALSPRVSLSFSRNLFHVSPIDMATTTTSNTVAIQQPVPTAGPRRAAVLLQRAAAALLPSSSSSSSTSSPSSSTAAATPTVAPWAKDDLLDTLYWIRQFLAVVAGPVAGLAGARGVSTFALFVTTAASAGLSWARAVGVDEDDVGGIGALLGEGLVQAMGLFTLLWSVIYSATGKGGSL